MNKKRIITGLIIVSVVIAGISFFAFRSRESVPRLVEAPNDQAVEVRQAATQALTKINQAAATSDVVNEAVDRPAERAEANIHFKLKSSPVSQVLELYKAVSGAELVMGTNPKFLRGSVTLDPARPLTKAEATQALEKALSEQAGVVIQRIDDKRVSVTAKGSAPIGGNRQPTAK